MPGKFKIQELSPDGERMIGAAAFPTTETGVRLFVHPAIPLEQVAHLCEMARDNPGELYDLVAWVGIGDNRAPVWSARLEWLRDMH